LCQEVNFDLQRVGNAVQEFAMPIYIPIRKYINIYKNIFKHLISTETIRCSIYTFNEHILSHKHKLWLL